MIQINLLPDLKVKFLKSQQFKKTVLMITIPAVLISIAAVATMSYIVYVGQKNELTDLEQKAVSSTNKLEAINGLGKILTIQNQLKSISTLHSQKPISSRVFGYLEQLTPNSVTISTLTIDFPTNKMTIVGTAPSTILVNQFADTLKFTNYLDDQNKTNQKPAFSNVTLSSFSFGTNLQYTVTVDFDQALFDINNTNVHLAIPNIVTTRSQTENPDNLFKQAPKPTTTTTTTSPGGQ